MGLSCYFHNKGVLTLPAASFNALHPPSGLRNPGWLGLGVGPDGGCNVTSFVGKNKNCLLVLAFHPYEPILIQICRLGAVIQCLTKK
jgi:hypothetical protein